MCEWEDSGIMDGPVSAPPRPVKKIAFPSIPASQVLLQPTSRVDPTCHLKNDPITSNQVGQAVHIPLESSNFDSCEVQSGGGQDDQEDHDQSEATHPNDNRTITIHFY